MNYIIAQIVLYKKQYIKLDGCQTCYRSLSLKMKLFKSELFSFS